MSRMLTKGFLDQKRYEAEERDRKERQRLAIEAEQRELRADIEAAYRLQQQIEAAKRRASEPKAPIVLGIPPVRAARATPPNESVRPDSPDLRSPWPGRALHKLLPDEFIGPEPFNPDDFFAPPIDPKNPPLLRWPPDFLPAIPRDKAPEPIAPEDFLPPIDPDNPPKLRWKGPEEFDPNIPIGRIPSPRTAQAAMQGEREGEGELRKLLRRALLEDRMKRARGV